MNVSPRFPTGILPNGKYFFRLLNAIFISSKPYSNFDANHVSFSGGCQGVVQLVHVSPDRNKYILLTKREVKMAGYWPSSLFAFLWTETKSRSIKT